MIEGGEDPTHIINYYSSLLISGKDKKLKRERREKGLVRIQACIIIIINGHL